MIQAKNNEGSSLRLGTNPTEATERIGLSGQGSQSSAFSRSTSFFEKSTSGGFGLSGATVPVATQYLIVVAEGLGHEPIGFFVLFPHAGSEDSKLAPRR